MFQCCSAQPSIDGSAQLTYANSGTVS